MNSQSYAQPVNEASATKRGRGRPAGSTSFVNVSVADLEQFVGTSSAIPVSRIWLEKMGLTIQAVQRTIQESEVETSIPKVEFKITKL